MVYEPIDYLYITVGAEGSRSGTEYSTADERTSVWLLQSDTEMTEQLSDTLSTTKTGAVRTAS